VRDELHVTGMDCASCAATIERSLKQLDGVQHVRVDVVGGRVRVDYRDDKVHRSELADAIRRVGYQLASPEPLTDRVSQVPRRTLWARHGRLIMTIASGATLGIALLLGRLDAATAATMALLAVSAIAGGWYVVPRGIQAARSRALDMNFLMSVAAGGAWLIGEQAEAAATLFLFAVAELLEAYSMDRARNAIRSLMELSPAEATVLRGGRELRLGVSDIEIGDVVLIRPGEKIAVDGDVVAGRSSVNQAPITGESMPVDKTPGDQVFAGTLNGHGALHVRSAKLASDTTLARIIHAVEDAQASRAPSQTFVDRFARVYTPAVVGFAVLIALLPPLLGVGAWSTWAYRALAMLVIACPCALVISTPVSIVSGLTAAARAGVLIKGGAFLEAAGAVSAVFFDKTGTLTEGRPAITDIIPLQGRSRDDVLRCAGAVEQHSEHPLARAILDEVAALAIALPDARDVEALPGIGARAQVDGELIHVGNERLARSLGVMEPTLASTLQRLEHEGRTVVIVATRREPLGIVAIADRVRPEAREAVDELRRAGIGRTVMLTGDNEGTARAIAEHVGVDEYHANLLPDDKLRIVRDCEAGGNGSAFVGDGVNDAPALAAARVGIAMGAAGTDVAIETADIALMGDDLNTLSFAVRLSRRTLLIIKQNIVFALAIKAVFLVLAAVGLATLWMAVAADMGASLLVVANGLRVLRAR